MQKSLKALKQQSIISSDEIQSLRRRLLLANPDLTETQHVRIFTNYFHAKLDDTLAIFDKSLQTTIKRLLLQRKQSCKHFAINALDVVEVYSQIKPTTPKSLTQLTSWVNQFEASPLSEEYLLDVTRMMQNGRSIGPFFIPDFRYKLEIGVALSALCGSMFFSMHCQHKTPAPFVHDMVIQEDTEVPVSSTLTNLLTSHNPVETLENLKETVLAWEQKLEADAEIACTLIPEKQLPENSLQNQLQYKEINQVALKEWLTNHGSLLATEPYFSTLIDTAQNFNINPLFLFAITGQEQNFVPKSHWAARLIANNPFNLFGSWEVYNTNIEDASCIVARTLINLGEDCPENFDQIEWINRLYAEDPNWHNGVSYFFNELESVASY